MTSTRALWANVLGFQLVWFACVAGAGNGIAWLGPLLSLLFAALTLGLGGQGRRDLRLLAVALPLGMLLDSSLAASGWLQFVQPGPWPMLAPGWILALWLGFVLTINHSLRFLHRRWPLAALFGLIGGPLAYLAAARGFAAVKFGAPLPMVLLVLGIAWALLLPILLLWNERGPSRQPIEVQS